MAIEFAFCFPVLLVILFGVVQVGQLLVAQRRLNTAGTSIGDIVARAQNWYDTDKTDLFHAAVDIMGSSATSAPDLRVSEVQVTSSGAQKYVWSDAQGTSMPAFAHCATASLSQLQGAKAPTLPAGAHVVVSEIRYVWTSPFSYVLKNPLTLKSTSFYSPRYGSVTRVQGTTSVADC